MDKPTTDSSTPPRPASPFNRRLQAYGHAAAPQGALRGEHRRHFVFQERLGVFVALLIFFAIAYGVTREFVRPLLLIGGVALVVALYPSKRRARRPVSQPGPRA